MAKAKTHPVVAPARPNDSEIEEMFEVALEKCKQAQDDAPYWDGVRQALGWVLGMYADEPEEE